jgi:YtkA-like
MKKLSLLVSILIIMFLAACGNSEGNAKKGEDTKAGEEELKELKVDFAVPETAEPGETVELKATVTYGDEKVTDANEVVFEVWKKDKKDDSTKIDGKNNQDGTYTAEMMFEEAGMYEMYAHTTARDLHTMPKKAIMVGEGEAVEGHDNTEGFALHFMEPENVVVGKETELMVHLQMDEKPLKKASVQYEVNKEGQEDKETIKATEGTAGEYTGTYVFSESGTYQLKIQVKADDGIKEQKEYEIVVK